MMNCVRGTSSSSSGASSIGKNKSQLASVFHQVQNIVRTKKTRDATRGEKSFD